MASDSKSMVTMVSPNGHESTVVESSFRNVYEERGYILKEDHLKQLAAVAKAEKAAAAEAEKADGAGGEAGGEGAGTETATTTVPPVKASGRLGQRSEQTGAPE